METPLDTLSYEPKPIEEYLVYPDLQLRRWGISVPPEVTNSIQGTTLGLGPTSRALQAAKSPRKEHRVVVLNLPPNVRYEDLLHLFESFKVYDTECINLGRSAGYAVVKLASAEEASRSIRDLSGTLIHGSRISLMFEEHTTGMSFIEEGDLVLLKNVTTLEEEQQAMEKSELGLSKHIEFLIGGLRPDTWALRVKTFLDSHGVTYGTSPQGPLKRSEVLGCYTSILLPDNDKSKADMWCLSGHRLDGSKIKIFLVEKSVVTIDEKATKHMRWLEGQPLDESERKVRLVEESIRVGVALFWYKSTRDVSSDDEEPHSNVMMGSTQRTHLPEQQSLEEPVNLKLRLSIPPLPQFTTSMTEESSSSDEEFSSYEEPSTDEEHSTDEEPHSNLSSQSGSNAMTLPPPPNDAPSRFDTKTCFLDDWRHSWSCRMHKELISDKHVALEPPLNTLKKPDVNDGQPPPTGSKSVLGQPSAANSNVLKRPRGDESDAEIPRAKRALEQPSLDVDEEDKKPKTEEMISPDSLDRNSKREWWMRERGILLDI